MAEVTIYTLAKELHMTPSMVSRAFNPEARISEEKRKIVMEAAKKYNFSPNRLASRLSMKTVRIGIILNSNFQVNTEKMITGIKQAYDNLKDYKVQYDITLLKSDDTVTPELREAADKYKTYDGVILSGMSAAHYTELIDDLYKVNPNIVQVQAINQKANYLFASKHNEKVASELAAEFLYNCLRKSKRKNVLLFTGSLKSSLHACAAESFKCTCDKLGLDLLTTVDMKDSEEYFEKILPEIFEKYGDFTDGIYISSGISSPLWRRLEEKGYDIPFVAFDSYEEIKEYMKKDIITATIAQNVTRQMEIAFELLIKHLIMGEECQKTVYTDVQLVLKGNIHQFD